MKKAASVKHGRRHRRNVGAATQRAQPGGVSALVAFVIPVVTPLAWLVAYAYRAALALRLGVPLEFVRVGINDIILSSVLVAAYSLVMVSVIRALDPLDDWWRTRPSPAAVTIGAVGLFLLLWGRWEQVFGTGSSSTLTLGASLMCVGLLLHELGRRSRLPAWFTRSEQRLVAITDPVPYWDRRDKHRIWYLAWWGLVVAAATAFSVGLMQADYRVDYLVTESNPARVVVLMSGDTAVLAPLERHTSTFSRQFSSVSISQLPTVAADSVGPLRSSRARR